MEIIIQDNGRGAAALHTDVNKSSLYLHQLQDKD